MEAEGEGIKYCVKALFVEMMICTSAIQSIVYLHRVFQRAQIRWGLLTLFRRLLLAPEKEMWKTVIVKIIGMSSGS